MLSREPLADSAEVGTLLVTFWTDGLAVWGFGTASNTPNPWLVFQNGWGGHWVALCVLVSVQVTTFFGHLAGGQI